MAEEEKKAAKPEEETEKAAAEGEEEDEDKKEPPPPPPEPEEEKKSPEIVLRVFMHCEGCARKVRRCLTGFQGVEEVVADCRGSRVVVKGEKADPIKVLERVQKKSHRKVELISPIPTPPPPPPWPPQQITEELHKIEEPTLITVVLGVYMHCDACAQEIKRRIHRMKGVQIVEPDLRGSQVKVKGFIEPQKLVDYVYKRTGKHATVINVEPEKKEEPKPDETQEAKEAKETKEENKAEMESGEKEQKKEEQVAKENNEGAGDDGTATTATGGGDGGGDPPAKEEADEAEDQKMELIKKEFYYYYPQNHQLNYPIYPPRFVHEMNAYPPQIFSDENPNACYVM